MSNLINSNKEPSHLVWGAFDKKNGALIHSFHFTTFENDKDGNSVNKFLEMSKDKLLDQLNADTNTKKVITDGATDKDYNNIVFKSFISDSLEALAPVYDSNDDIVKLAPCLKITV